MKNKKTSIYIILSIVILILLGVAIYMFYQLQVMKKNYKAGKEEFNKGNYTEAQARFKAAGRYNNGKKVSQICGVLEQMVQDNFDKGAELAKDIPDYKVKDEDLQTSIDEIRKQYYARAESSISANNLETGMHIYQCLKDYEDAEQAANYYDGLIHVNNSDAEGAIPLFEAAGSYSDAADQAKKCNDYLEAAALQEKGDDSSMEEAGKIFTDLGDFMDAQDRGLACRSVKLFKDAQAKADAQDYDGAYKILNEYPNNPYPGWSTLLNDCSNQIDYKKANKYYDDEHYYKAYELYDALGNFKDAEKKKKKCVRDTPSSGVMDQEDDYESSSVKLTFKNNGDVHNYIKMYNSNDKLIARIFVKKNQEATISTTSGTYHINKAYGNTWYGKKDMFGDSGYYTKCVVNGGYDFDLQSGYIYTLSSGANASGDAVGGESVGADGF